MRMSLLVGAVALAAGCGAPVAGEPTRESGSKTLPQGDSTKTSTKAPHSVGDLCGLLTEDEATGLAALSDPEEGFSTFDGHPQCTWSGDASLTIGWSEGKNTTMAAKGPEITLTPTEIHGRTAVQSKEVSTVVICQVLTDITGGMISATVTLNLSGEGRYDECKVATDAANIIVPKVT